MRRPTIPRSWLALIAAAPLSACAASSGSARAAILDLPVCEAGMVAASVHSLEDPGAESIRSFLELEGWVAADSVRIVEAERPELLNATVVSRSIHRYYPVELRDRGISGTVEIAVLIDPEGEVSQTQLVSGARYADFNEAGAAVISTAIFAPPVYSGCRLPFWTRFDVAFTVER